MRRFIINVLLVIASIAVFFLLLEIGLALFWPSKILVRSYHELYHPVLGWVNSPNVDGRFYLRRSVSFHRHHNNQGLRSRRDTTHQKRSGTGRVLLLGDSFFWGYGVNDEEVISEVLQQRIGPRFEVINGSVSGYGTDQELLWLTEEGLKFAPDVVILGVFPANDWDEIGRSINYGYPKPFFSLEKGRLILHNVPVPDTRETRRKAFEEPESAFGRLKKFLRYHTHAYPFIAKRLNALPGVRNILLEIGLATEFTPSLPGIPDLTLKKETIRPLFEALVREIHMVCREAGVDLLVVFIPEKENTSGAPALYAGIIGDAGTRNTTASSYLSRVTAAQKIQYLDLLPLVREHQSRGEILYVPSPYDHHWTPAGHVLAAEALEAWLRTHEHLSGKHSGPVR